jgi:hypothetical protein
MTASRERAAEARTDGNLGSMERRRHAGYPGWPLRPAVGGLDNEMTQEGQSDDLLQLV